MFYHQNNFIVSMVSFEFLAVVLSILGLAASLFYYARVLENANKAQKNQLETRQAQLFMQLYNQSVNNPEFMVDYYKFRNQTWETYDEYIEQVIQNPENMRIVLRIGGFLEGVSVLVQEDLVSIRLVSRLVKNVVLDWWGKMEPIYADLMREQNMKGDMETKILYNRLIKYLEENPELAP
jgi:hypothetical protein